MRKASLFLTLILFFIPTIAEGADWVLIGETQKGMIIYVDKKSIKHISNNRIRAWTKFVYKTPEPFEARGQLIKEMIGYDEWDCKEAKKKTLDITYYYTDGTNDGVRGNEEWRYVRPDTIEDAVFEYLCKSGK